MNTLNHDTKQKGFKNLIFKTYAQDKNYDRIKCNLLNVRETMIAAHECFNKITLKKQFEYCNTIALIALHTQMQFMDENRPLSLPTNANYKYSMDRNFKKPRYVEVTVKASIGN